jgi:hypothetical protein
MIVLAWVTLVTSFLGVLGQGINSIVGKTSEKRFISLLDAVLNIVVFAFALLFIIGGK